MCQVSPERIVFFKAPFGFETLRQTVTCIILQVVGSYELGARVSWGILLLVLFLFLFYFFSS